MSQIIACIDASKSAHSVCNATAWCSQRLSAPALALHVLDKDESLALSDLTGAIGLGAREHLLKELAELDHQRAKLAMEQGKIMLAAAEAQMRKQGCQEVASRQLHASLPEALLDMAPTLGLWCSAVRVNRTSAPKMRSAVNSRRFCVYLNTLFG